MSPLRLAVIGLFVFPLGASAQPPDPPLEPLWRIVPNLPDGAFARVGASPFVLSERHNAIVLSPDGKRIAAGEFKVVIYDADTAVNAEQRVRAEKLIAGLTPKPIKLDLTRDIPPKKTGSIPPYLREVRALAVLERISTPEAKKVAESLAAGDAGLMVTREAKRILARWR